MPDQIARRNKLDCWPRLHQAIWQVQIWLLHWAICEQMSRFGQHGTALTDAGVAVASSSTWAYLSGKVMGKRHRGLDPGFWEYLELHKMQY